MYQKLYGKESKPHFLFLFLSVSCTVKSLCTNPFWIEVDTPSPGDRVLFQLANNSTRCDFQLSCSSVSVPHFLCVKMWGCKVWPFPSGTAGVCETGRQSWGCTSIKKEKINKMPGWNVTLKLYKTQGCLTCFEKQGPFRHPLC